jgi:recombination protein RecA
MFGSPETTTGGLALKFYATMRFDIRRIAAIKKDEDVIGSRTRVKVVKNKVAPPFREAEFDLIYGKGISRLGELVDIGAEHGVFTKSGTWYAFGEMRIGQGRDAAIDFLKDNAPVAAKAEIQLYETLKIPRASRIVQRETADEDNRAPVAKKK